MSDAIEHWRELDARRAELAGQLSDSLRLRTHFPEAFEHGKARVSVTGNGHSPRSLTFVVTRGDGSTIERPALDVPPKLWLNALARFAETPRLSHGARRVYRKLQDQAAGRV